MRTGRPGLVASITLIPLDYLTAPYLDSMILLYPVLAAIAAWSEGNFTVTSSSLQPLDSRLIPSITSDAGDAVANGIGRKAS